MAEKVKPTEGVAQTVIQPDPAPEPVKAVWLVSPWGSRVSVAADSAGIYKDAGYTVAGK